MHFKEINIKNLELLFLLIKKKLGTKNILIDEKNYRGLIIYFTRYDRGIRTFNLYHYELMQKIEEHE